MMDVKALMKPEGVLEFIIESSQVNSVSFIYYLVFFFHMYVSPAIVVIFFSKNIHVNPFLYYSFKVV